MELTPPALRVLGCLVEKAMATPQQYPLSVNALQNACNQLTGRDPVVDYDEETVRAGLDDLKAHQLVKAEYARSSRTPKYAHRLAEQLDLDAPQMAVLALLLLRGDQTVGELRGRAERMHTFGSLEDVDATLQALATHRFGPLAVLLPRAPGQKEPRWAHQLGGDAPVTEAVGQGAPVTASPPPPGGRIDRLEDEVADLRRLVEGLAEQVRALRDQAGDQAGA